MNLGPRIDLNKLLRRLWRQKYSRRLIKSLMFSAVEREVLRLVKTSKMKGLPPP